MGRKPKEKASPPKPARDAAFFPRTVGKFFYVFSDGALKWVREGEPEGRFSVRIAEREVIDEGLQDVGRTSWPMTPDSQPPRWGRVTVFQRISCKRFLGCFGSLPGGKRGFGRFSGKFVVSPEMVGKKVAIFDSDAEADAAGFRPSGRVLVSKFMRWREPVRDAFRELRNNETPGQLASEWWERMHELSRDFPAFANDANPHRVVWWIREGERLTRLKTAPPAQSQIAATIFHFCPTPGAFIRVEILEPFTVESWQEVIAAQRPKTLLELLDLMAHNLKAFGEPEMNLADPSKPEGWGFRRNPKWDWWREANWAIRRVRQLVEWNEEGETRESIRLRIEEAARQAYILGEQMTLLGISPKVPVLRRREKMDQRTGRPKEYPKLKDAVRAFVRENLGAKKGVILKRLKKEAKSGNGQIGFAEDREVYFHGAEEKPEWKESTLSKEISLALAEMTGKPGKSTTAKDVPATRRDAKKTGRK